jgi:hypothetical protein
MTDLAGKYGVLKHLVSKPERPLASIARVLSDLKLMMLDTPFLTHAESTLSVNDRLMFRHILEINAMVSIESDNTPEFARVIKQLKAVYYRGTGVVPPSHDMPLILSLYLVYLLTQQRFTEMNMELALAKKICGDSPFLDFAFKLSQAVADNSFASLCELQKNQPSPLFESFAQSLLDGARNAHADSIQSAYPTMNVTSLTNILHFEKREEAVAFIEKRGWRIEKDGEAVAFPEQADKGKVVVDKAARYVELAVAISGLQ